MIRVRGYIPDIYPRVYPAFIKLSGQQVLQNRHQDVQGGPSVTK